MRRLIVCCDGTWNRADWEGGTATNVLRIARAIEPVAAAAADGQPISQIVYYHPGVGTGNRLDRLLGGGLGLGLSQNVRDAYAFLVNNYEPGDEIFLFGFSRGAYTARTVSGLIGSIGLLLKSQMGAFLDAWAWHRLPHALRARHAVAFERNFPGRRVGVQIQCIAVWDTVGALGIPKNRITGTFNPCKSQYSFHDVTLGDHVAHAFQALAIDEHRHPFTPSVWARSPTAPPSQIVSQMWFAGVHSDIGGGYPQHGPSDTSLLWIASELAGRNLLALDIPVLVGQMDQRAPYGAGDLHKSLSFFYRTFTGRLNRPVAAGPTEAIHATVAQRINAGDYRDARFLTKHAGRFATLNPLETQISGYAIQPYVNRPPFLPEKPGLCDRLVRRLMGR